MTDMSSNAQNLWDDHDLQFTAREYVGCVTVSDVQRVLGQFPDIVPVVADSTITSTSVYDITPNPPKRLTMGEVTNEDVKQFENQRRLGRSRAAGPSPHYFPSCICRKIHQHCNSGYSPGENMSLQWRASMVSRSYGRGLNVASLQTAAEGGCWFCSIIYAGVQTALGALAKKVSEVHVIDESLYDTMPTEVGVKFEDSFKYLEFYIHDRNATRCTAFQPFPEIPESTALPATFGFIRRQIKECTEKHGVCQSEQGALPTRVLEISVVDRKYHIRLHISNGAKAAYVTLSHCWGSASTLRTTKETLTERTSGIAWSLLPRTFRDAVCITHTLGHRFLWIDSLCIVQEDKADWERESSRMCEVYKNCAFMISADHAADGTKGCFNNITSRSWEVELPERGRTGVFVRESLSHSGIDLTSVPDDASPPLSRRAWTFQERLLAPRVLHYMEKELIWECRFRSVCQCGHYLGGQKPENHMDQSSKSLLIRDPYWGLWFDFVRQYSARTLTKQTDRLAALSGLAQEFQRQVLQGEAAGDLTNRSNLTDATAYVAGLWKEDLVAGLGWSLNSGERARARPSEKIAPTWSWASVESGVNFRFIPTNVKAISVSCKPKGHDPFGSVSQGQLTLFTYITRVTISAPEAGASDSLWTVRSPKSPELRTFSFQMDYIISQADLSEEEGTDIVAYAVYINHSCSMVVRKSNSDVGAYERLGIFECEDSRYQEDEQIYRDEIEQAVILV